QIPELAMYLFRRISSEFVCTFGLEVFLKSSFFTNLDFGFFPNLFSPVAFGFPKDGFFLSPPPFPALFILSYLIIQGKRPILPQVYIFSIMFSRNVFCNSSKNRI